MRGGFDDKKCDIDEGVPLLPRCPKRVTPCRSGGNSEPLHCVRYVFSDWYFRIPSANPCLAPQRSVALNVEISSTTYP